jgi:hypothetical protein
VPDDHFEGIDGLRQILLWTVATRQALERWESSVAAAIRLDLQEQRRPPGQLIWTAEIDRHWTFIAARNLLRALKTTDLGLMVDGELEAAVIQHRDLLEHWDENMPVFNIRPRQADPGRKSGREYARKYPDSTPYGNIRWNSADGPLLGSGVTAMQLHALLDDVQARTVAQHPSLESYIPNRARSPWLGDEAGGDRWFPKPLKEPPDNHA